MKILNTFKEKDNLKNITLLTRTCISSIRQLRAGEPVYIRPCAPFQTPERRVN